MSNGATNESRNRRIKKSQKEAVLFFFSQRNEKDWQQQILCKSHQFDPDVGNVLAYLIPESAELERAQARARQPEPEIELTL